MQKSLFDLAGTIHEINIKNGWNVPEMKDWNDDYKIPTFLALVHSEVSEALEGFRANDRENFSEELADVVIRILDICYGLDIDLYEEIESKLKKNRTRGFKHGGKRV